MHPNSQGFDEVMIVNPYDPASGLEGVSTMSYPSAFGYYHQPPDFAYGYAYAEPEELGWYAMPYPETDELGYYAEDDPYGEADDYGETDDYGEGDDYGEADEYGDFGEDEPYGFYAEDDPYGYSAEDDPYGEADEYGYYAEDEPMDGIPEMVGYGEDEFGEDDPMISGYVRDGASPFNAGCPIPTNVAGYGEADELAGYVRPGTVNAQIQSFTPQPGITQGVPPTFAPLW